MTIFPHIKLVAFCASSRYGNRLFVFSASLIGNHTKIPVTIGRHTINCVGFWREGSGELLRVRLDTIVKTLLRFAIGPACPCITIVYRSSNVQQRAIVVVTRRWQNRAALACLDGDVVLQRTEVRHKERVVLYLHCVFDGAIGQSRVVVPMVECVTLFVGSRNFHFRKIRLTIVKFRYRAMRIIINIGADFVQIWFEIGRVSRILRHHIVVDRTSSYTILPTSEVITSVWCGFNFHLRLIFVFQASGWRNCAKTSIGNSVEFETIFCENCCEGNCLIRHRVVARIVGIVIFLPFHKSVARFSRRFQCDCAVVRIFVSASMRNATPLFVVHIHGYAIAHRLEVGGVDCTLRAHGVRTIHLGATIAPTLQLVTRCRNSFEWNNLFELVTLLIDIGIDSTKRGVARLNGELIFLFCKDSLEYGVVLHLPCAGCARAVAIAPTAKSVTSIWRGGNDSGVVVVVSPRTSNRTHVGTVWSSFYLVTTLLEDGFDGRIVGRNGVVERIVGSYYRISSNGYLPMFEFIARTWRNFRLERSSILETTARIYRAETIGCGGNLVLARLQVHLEQRVANCLNCIFNLIRCAKSRLFFPTFNFVAIVYSYNNVNIFAVFIFARLRFNGTIGAIVHGDVYLVCLYLENCHQSGIVLARNLERFFCATSEFHASLIFPMIEFVARSIDGSNGNLFAKAEIALFGGAALQRNFSAALRAIAIGNNRNLDWFKLYIDGVLFWFGAEI